MVLSRDRGTAKQKVDQGYGLVCDASGKPIPDLIVSDTNQEHGIVSAAEAGPCPICPSARSCAFFPTTRVPRRGSMRVITFSHEAIR